MVKSYNRFELARTFGIITSPSSVQSLPNGTVAVGACEAVHVWDLKTGELRQRLVDSTASPRAQVLTLAHEPSSQLLAAGYSDGSIRVWDLQSGQPLITFQGHRTGITVVVFDESGTRLISGSHDTTIIVWDLVAEQGLYRLKGHKAPVTALVLPFGEWLVSVSKDGVLKLWDMESQFSVETHVAHKSECWAACLAGPGRLVTASNTTEMRIWDLDFDAPDGSKIKAKSVLEKQSKHRPTGLIYSARQRLLFVGSGDALQSWRERTPEELRRAQRRKEKRKQKKGSESVDTEDAIDVGEFLPHAIARARGKICGLCQTTKDTIVASLGSNSIEEWRFPEKEVNEPVKEHVVDHPGHRTDVRDVALSSDGRLVASGSHGQVKLHNVRSGQCVRTLDDAGYILCIRFLPGDALVAVGTKEGSLDVYDVAKSARVCHVQAHEGPTWSLDISADGQTIVTGGADKAVKFWSLKVVDGTELRLRNTHKLEFTDDVLAVKLSPDNRFVAAALLDNTVKVYYRDTLKFFLNLYGHQLPVLSMDISADSKLLITSSADKNIKIWGLDFGDCHKSIFGHDDAVLRVAFEPGSHNFVSASKDGFVKYWDGDKFVEIQQLRAHHSEVWALAISSQGEFIVSASHDKTLRVWNLTDEPLFLDEERENQLEQTYEENLLESLEGPRTEKQDEEEQDTAEAVTKHTIDSLKAGEKLFEALDVAWQDVQPDRPNQRNVILSALNVSAEQYLMDSLAKIKPSLVEDALLTFPLDKIVQLLHFVRIWLERRWNLPLVSRVLFFCLRSFHRQLVANHMLAQELEEIRDLLREALQELADKIGYNVARLTILQDAWALEHVRDFDLTEESSSSARKRAFTNVAL